MKDLPSRPGRGDLTCTLEDLAEAALAFYAETVPMTGSLFSEPKLLAQHRTVLREKGLGPQLALPTLVAYLREEQRLGRIAPEIDIEAGAAMLLGACFQRAFLSRFLGNPIEDRQEQRFAKALVKALLRQ
jgi:hypothetical protein